MPNTEVTSISTLSDAELDAVAAGTRGNRQSINNRVVQVGVNAEVNVSGKGDSSYQGGSQSNSNSNTNSNSNS